MRERPSSRYGLTALCVGMGMGAALLWASYHWRGAWWSSLSAALGFVAVVAGRRYGVLGVASGVVVGAIVGQLINYFLNLPRTQGRLFDRVPFLKSAIVRPVLCFLPLGFLGLMAGSDVSERLSLGASTLLFALSFALVWKFAIDRREKETVRVLINRGRLLLGRFAA